MQIKCTCGSLFGIEQADGSLAIKYRDLFRIVRGSVSGPCRKCGADVTWPQQAYTIPPMRPPNLLDVYTCNCACNRCLSGDCCRFQKPSVGWPLTTTTTVDNT